MVVGASEIVVTGGAGGGADEPPPHAATIPRDSSASAHPAIRTYHPWSVVRIEVPFVFGICAAFVIIRWRVHAAKRDQHATVTIPEQARSRFDAFLCLPALNITRLNVIIISIADEISQSNQVLRYK
jgi:hypothetical protein